MTKIAKTKATIHGLRASLKPHVYRDIEIDSAYDYGDQWRFKVEVREISELPPGGIVWKVTAQVGKAPDQYLIVSDDN